MSLSWGYARRYLLFNAVGAAGVAVQLGVLAALVQLGDVHYLLATAIAVETAILHNFAWHQRWTWRDRPGRARAGITARLLRFHLLNGAVSLAGNIAIVSALTGGVGVDPVIASAAAVAACSILNFAASEVLVFKTAIVVLFVLAIAGTPLAAGGGQLPHLQSSTASAWQSYEAEVDRRYREAQPDGQPFFAHDQFRRTPGWRESARQGSVVMTELDAPAPGKAAPSVPDGRIHHWVGAVFIPDATVDGVVRRLQAQAGQESASYQDVLASRLLDRDGDQVRVFMKLRRESVITVVYNTEHHVVYRRLGNARASSRSVATRIAELRDPGTPGERERGPAEDRGFLWRLNAYWRYEQADGGVFVECESVSLSRGVPLLLRPFITGIVEGIARESLQRTLVSLRRVLTAG
ncbi:MAG TPA: GtrA family protein [Vicinamibacterales bacterium]|nr:GtrA family protein [Vicinamibacterales bacterium]